MPALELKWMLLFNHLLWCIASSSSIGRFYTIRGVDFTEVLSDRSVASSESPSRARCSLQCLATANCCAAIYNMDESVCYLYDSCDWKCPCNSESQNFLMRDVREQPLCDEYSYEVPLPRDCQEVFEAGNFQQNGVYTLRPNATWNQTVEAVCQFDDNSGWTVIQRRLDGSEDFFRGWNDYVNGFGNKSGEYWIGLDAIYWLTRSNKKLSVFLEDHDGATRTANYTTFYVDGGVNLYQLSVSGYSGDAGDALGGTSWGSHDGMKFSTKDNDNDQQDSASCAQNFKGGWWYNSCHDANLNGLWYPGGVATSSSTGASWAPWRGYDYSYKTIYMKLGC